MTTHFLIFTNTCPQSTLYWPTITHITHTKLRWPININNSITATQHFQKEKRKSHTTQPDSHKIHYVREREREREREWIRKIWLFRRSRSWSREREKTPCRWRSSSRSRSCRSRSPSSPGGGVTIQSQCQAKSLSHGVLEFLTRRSSRCVLRVENLLCSSTRLSIAEIVYFLFWFWFYNFFTLNFWVISWSFGLCWSMKCCPLFYFNNFFNWNFGWSPDLLFHVCWSKDWDRKSVV